MAERLMALAASGLALAATAGAEDPYELTWGRQLGTTGFEIAYGVAVDSADNPYITGYTSADLAGPSAGFNDGFLAKYDASGALLWIRQFGSQASDSSHGVALDGGGNAYITGATLGSLGGAHAGDFDIFLMKYSPSGTRLWARQLGTSVRDASAGVAVDDPGNAYVVGGTDGSLGGPGAGDSDAVLVKYSASGAQLWARQLGTSASDEAKGAAVDAAGNVFMTGRTMGRLGGSSAGGWDAFLAKYSPAGALLWVRQFGSAEWDFSNGVAVDSAGNAYITGSTLGSPGGPSAGSYDVLLAKYSPLGARVWAIQFGTPQREEGFGVAVDDAGDVLITGFTEGSMGGASAGDRDAFLAKVDPDGLLRWVWQIGTPALDHPRAVAAAGDRAYIAGWTDGGSLGGPALGGWDAFLLQLAPPGCFADCDGSGTLDFFDFICFQNLFATGDPGADCDEDRELTFFDFLCFQNAFAVGCP